MVENRVSQQYWRFT